MKLPFSAGLLHSVLLPALSGLLLVLAYPKASQGYLAWIALVPLLWSVAVSRGTLRAFAAGALCGTLQCFFLLIWIPPVIAQYGGMSLILAWLLFAVLALMLGLYPALCCAATRYAAEARGAAMIFLFPFAWTALEFAQNYFIFGGFPWLLLGYTQTPYLRVVQAADIAGVFGISFLIAAFNCALCWAWLRRLRRPAAWVPLAVTVSVLVAVLLYGGAAWSRWNRLEPKHTAALLQGNIGFDEPAEQLRWKFEQGYIEQADTLGDAGVDLLVLPESPSPLIYQDDSGYRGSLDRLARRFPMGLIFNNIAYDGGEGVPRYFNSVYFITPGAPQPARYDKIHLVPFGEYVPMRRLFFFAESITKDVSDFNPGKEFVTVPLAGRPANAMICFEAVFPGLSREFVKRGSELIVNVTNDGWYGDSAAPYQHLAIARWRAVENRRYLLRSANSGISAVISPSGELGDPTRLLERDVSVARFDFVRETTVYARRGDLLPWACVIITVSVLAACLKRRYVHHQAA